MTAPSLRALSIVVFFFCGCRANDSPASVPIRRYLEEPSATDRPRTGQRPAPRSTAAPEVLPTGALAWVNGRMISAQRFNHLLVEGYGLSVLEQLIALELVKHHAARERVNVTAAEIETEYLRSLEEMARTVADEDEPSRLREIGEQVLQDFLRQKNFSLAEYKVSVERNAYLRKLVDSEVPVNQEDVQQEFDRRFGRQAVVRHIVLPDLKAVGDVRGRLDDGEDFAKMAGAFSIHRISGSAGGLLPPFTEGDAQVPARLREVAFGLQAGQTSDAVNIDGQYHVVRLERFLQADDQALTPPLAMRLRLQLQNRRTRQGMQELERRLYEQAQIRIEDPTLKNRFEEKRRDKLLSNH